MQKKIKEVDHINPLGIRTECMEETTHKILILSAKPVYAIDLKVLISRL